MPLFGRRMDGRPVRWLAEATAGDNNDRQCGTLLGLGIGDALGAAIGFEMPGTFPEVMAIKTAAHNRFYEDLRMSQQGKIRLLIADDHEMLRSGVKAMLAGTEIKVIGEVVTGRAAVAYALEHDVDVVLLDVRMPDGDGLTALGRIKLDKPDLPILMLSAFDNPAYVARAVALEASGFLLKGCARDELVNAITKAATGERIFTRDELRRVSGSLTTPRITADIEVPLTQREAEVLRHLANGLTNEELAEVLQMGYETVKEHLKNVFRKIGINDRTQAAVWAVRKGLA